MGAKDLSSINVDEGAQVDLTREESSGFFSRGGVRSTLRPQTTAAAAP